MTFQNLIQSINLSQNNTLYLICFGILLTTLALSYLEIRLYHRTIESLERTQKLWDDAVLWAMHLPLNLLIWVFGFAACGKVFKMFASHPEIWKWVDVARNASTVLLLTWFLIRLSCRLEEKYLEKDGSESTLVDHTSAQAIAQIVRIAILISAALAIAKIFFSVPLTGLWAVGGASSIIIGWAAKDLLANLFGAIMIFLDRPFSVGDWIRSPDRQIEGTVEYIGWRLTRIRTFDKRPVYIPNSVFATICLENATRMHCWRIREMVEIRYQDSDKVDNITRDIHQMLVEHPHIDEKQTCVVNLTAFGPSALEILIYCFTDTKTWASYLAIRQNVLLKVAAIVDAHDAKLAFPTQTLEIQNPMGFDQTRANQQPQRSKYS